MICDIKLLNTTHTSAQMCYYLPV